MLVFRIATSPSGSSGARRPSDRRQSRPLLGLAVLIAFLATGSGLEGAILGTAIGTTGPGSSA